MHSPKAVHHIFSFEIQMACRTLRNLLAIPFTERALGRKREDRFSGCPATEDVAKNAGNKKYHPLITLASKNNSVKILCPCRKSRIHLKIFSPYYRDYCRVEGLVCVFSSADHGLRLHFSIVGRCRLPALRCRAVHSMLQHLQLHSAPQSGIKTELHHETHHASRKTYHR